MNDHRDPNPVEQQDAASALIAAYVQWLRTRDDAYRWAWEDVHDGIWWTRDALESLDIVLAIVQEVASDPAALEKVGAGPLEDLIGGDERVMLRLEDQATRSDALRAALRATSQVKQREPGFENLHDVVFEQDG